MKLIDKKSLSAAEGARRKTPQFLSLEPALVSDSGRKPFNLTNAEIEESLNPDLETGSRQKS